MKKNIMVVDDNYLSLDSIYLSLKSHGFAVKTYSSPLDAIAAFKTEKFDAVLSDYYMPDMRGDEFLAKVQLIDPSVKTFLFSGFVSDDKINEIQNLKSGIFLSKPLDIEKIVLTLEQ